MANKVQIDIVANDKASGVLRGVGSALGSITVAVAAFGAAAVYAFGRMASEALKVTADWERLGFTMESMVARELRAENATLSMAEALDMAGGKSQELLGWIQKLAIESPFSTQSVATVFQQMLAYGFTSTAAQQLTQNLLDLAAATGRTEEQLGQIGYALGQINASDKLLMQDLRQLINAGVDVNGILKEMGYDLGDVGKESISSADFLQKFNEIAERDYSGTVDRNAKSWSSMLGAFKDIKDIGLRYLFEGMFQELQPLVAEFTDWALGPGLERMKDLGKTLGGITRNIISLVSAIASGRLSFEGFTKAFGSILSAKLGEMDWEKIRANLTSIDWNAVSQKLISGIEAIDWNQLGVTLGEFLKTAFAVAKDIAMETDWTGIFSSLGTAFAEFSTGIVGGSFEEFKAVWAENFVQMEKMFALLGGIIARTLQQWARVGAAIVEGLKWGVMSGWVAFVAWLKDKINQAVEAILEALGISSPSKVFANIGRNMMLGLAQGIGDGVVVPIKALQATVPQMASATIGSAMGKQNHYYYGARIMLERGAEGDILSRLTE